MQFSLNKTWDTIVYKQFESQQIYYTILEILRLISDQYSFATNIIQEEHAAMLALLDHYNQYMIPTQYTRIEAFLSSHYQGLSTNALNLTL